MTARPAFIKSRAAALAACAVVLLVVAVFVVTPVVAAFSAQSDEIDASLQQLGFYRAEIAAKPMLEAELKSLNEKGASVPGVIDAESTALAQAQLQSQMKALVEANKGSVQSMQIVPVSKQGGFEIIAVQCDLSVPQSQLKSLAYALAAHAPYLFVDEASISAPNLGPDDIGNKQAILDIRWTVHGYRWGRTK
ncbi:MAG: hypothetical protein JOZ72_13475 [Alphaproteobacteria bacterium]|nr:hypothetical protein [Alphaproteobacteria bacterium]